MQDFTDYHAHLYFDANEAEEAGHLCQAIRDDLGLAIGRIHPNPVGPHPRGSCQITVPTAMLGKALDWLLHRRGRFTVFCHGNSGNDLADHTRHVFWLGDAEKLDLRQFGPV
ncbi:DOPA 4,5-dioxygenase [Novosphingobium sp. B1]|nr:DOPA 4,5-dioxygenase [Novosphingobium sp. B1]